MRATIILVFVLLLQGCAGGGAKYGDSEVTKKQPALAHQPGNGVVVLSMAQTDYRSNSIIRTLNAEHGYTWSFDIRRLDNGRLFQFRGGSSLVEGLTLGLFDDDDVDGGHVFAHSLPQGAYEVVSFTVHHIQGMPTGTIESSWSPKAPFSLPFTVEAGGVHYIGEWRCIPQTSKGLFGMNVKDGCAWEISDRFARDTPILRTKYPDFAWDRLSNDTLKSGTAPSQVVTFK